VNRKRKFARSTQNGAGSSGGRLTTAREAHAISLLKKVAAAPQSGGPPPFIGQIRKGRISNRAVALISPVVVSIACISM